MKRLKGWHPVIDARVMNYGEATELVTLVLWPWPFMNCCKNGLPLKVNHTGWLGVKHQFTDLLTLKVRLIKNQVLVHAGDPVSRFVTWSEEELAAWWACNLFWRWWQQNWSVLLQKPLIHLPLYIVILSFSCVRVCHFIAPMCYVDCLGFILIPNKNIFVSILQR